MTNMRVHHYLIAATIAAGLVILAAVLTPLVFAQRVIPGVYLADTSLAGIPTDALPTVIADYERGFLNQSVELVLGEKIITRPLRSLGITVNREQTQAALAAAQKGPLLLGATIVSPVLNVKQADMINVAREEFSAELTLPTDAALTVTPARTLAMSPSVSGESIDLLTLRVDLEQAARYNAWSEPIQLKSISAAASVGETETSAAQALAQTLLRDGFPMSDGTTTWTIQPFTIARLLRFIPVSDPAKADNEILGVTFDGEELRQYLTTTISPAVTQPAIDARFERQDNIVTQFALPQEGRALNIEASIAAIDQALKENQRSSHVVVDVTKPAVQDVADITSLGIGDLLATGDSDFSGSPLNRIHNITEGTKRYHGLLIAAGQEFSFNEFLGPVDGDHGFKPELVIKNHQTIPEFGGGLCQVSTTLFRAATFGGLKITARRNHAYAVRYYGIPGFDATIYPPYTDLRFTNNTPGYILVQAKIEGKKLTFELWGTHDNRTVTVDGPHPYSRTSGGAVKATLVQKVIKDGAVLIDDTFYSNYQSPALFHKKTLTPNATPTPQPSPRPATGGAKPSLKPSPKPAAVE